MGKLGDKAFGFENAAAKRRRNAAPDAISEALRLGLDVARAQRLDGRRTESGSSKAVRISLEDPASRKAVESPD
jgi:hypothetical protein